MSVQKTLEYYNRNAREFAEGTSGVDFSGIQNRFLSHLPEGALILDFGCGSGRDTRYFLGKGFRVEAADGSEELCRLASVYTGIPVKQMLFQELEETEKYDGIWACASILHLRREELPEVFRKMYRALKPGGILYVSFKYGDFEGERNGRYFTDMTEETAEELLESVPELKIKERWVTGDVRAGRGAEKWLNMILRRSDTCWR
ncbi:MAG TPA: class I SAM-dependent methyltransferase [Candidatus Eisenbergiella merdipullorum]|uniref:Class I SAM-dependent methyltransferase n=1 Tax=Candidatus Eisenbergiella merdipullorum TaxID=2838553 RepID=A0A9D2L1A6_9FIRM|nr:class I SAM-dependent methyltransferase [Candidatus Eisenbergiella merdipullorum]HJD46582.1 class I SAM-dependent methyltransferase [Candidatus Mediterraneibacter norfolkensis]